MSANNNNSSTGSILITGATRGIGLLVATSLAKLEKRVIFTGRDEEKLKQLSQEYPHCSFISLDMANKGSIVSLPERLKEQGISEISVIVNNAAINKEGWNEDIFKETIQINVEAPLLLIDTLLPLLQHGAKIINVTGGIGAMYQQSESYRERFSNIHNLSEILSLPFVEDDDQKSKAMAIYALSKALFNCATRFLSEDERVKEKNVKVSAVCPGWCKTDMGGRNAPREPQQGADSILWMLNHDDLPSGSFFRDGRVIRW